MKLEEIERILLENNLLKCRFCNSPLERKARYYPHKNGIKLEDFEEKQWIYFRCTNKKCSYDWSLWKLLGKK